MAVAVDFDVAFQIELKQTNMAGESAVQARNHRAEHTGDEILAAKSKCRGDDMRLILADNGKSGFNETPGLLWYALHEQGTVKGLARGEFRKKCVDRMDAGFGFEHRLAIQLEVTQVVAVEIVAFLSQDNVIDEPPANWKRRREPRHSYTGQHLLKSF